MDIKKLKTAMADLVEWKMNYDVNNSIVDDVYSLKLICKDLDVDFTDFDYDYSILVCERRIDENDFEFLYPTEFLEIIPSALRDYINFNILKSFVELLENDYDVKITDEETYEAIYKFMEM